MEAGRSLLSSLPPFPSRTHFRNSHPSSVSMLHEQTAPAVTSIPTASIGPHFPASVLLQESHEEFRPHLNMYKEDRNSQGTLDGQQTYEVNSSHDLDQLAGDFNYQLLHRPGLWSLMMSSQAEQNLPSSLTTSSVTIHTHKLFDVDPTYVIDLSEEALSASREASSLAESSINHDNAVSSSLDSATSSSFSVEELKTIRSTRHLERQSKNRRMHKGPRQCAEHPSSKRADKRNKTSEGFDPNDPLRLFLWGPETKQLLTAEEESELIVRVQELMRLEEVKARLQSQFDREPTLFEWAEAVGISWKVLRAQVLDGKRSQEKLISANLRMVVHIAKNYQGRGLSLQDLLQEGSIGLMKSVEKFKPHVGCRFGSYAYWWIRQTVRKAIFQYSRTIRLPDNIYGLLGKVLEAKRLYIQEKNHHPTTEELARRVGITVKKLEKLLLMARLPLSLQQSVWADQDTTFQEVTADPEIETPDMSVSKRLMRRHVRGLLNNLSPRERQIMRLRYGLDDGKQKSLSEIGNMFGLCKERVRQLESRALYRLKQCLGTHGLEAYTDLLV